MRGERVIVARMGSSDRWLEEWPSRLTAMVDLVCFPGAGAGASLFRPWVEKLPGFSALLACQLPGRENRIDEPPVGSLAQAAETVASAYLEIRPSPRPVTVFGHSMGGVLAFEFARRLAVMHHAPAAVVISASTPPGKPSGARHMDRDELKELLIAYDPANRVIVSNEELFVSLAPTLQSDISLLRRHEIAPPLAKLNVQACLLSGEADPIVPQGSVAAWSRYFAGPASQHTFAGGHHFPFGESSDAVLALLARLLREATTGRATG